MKTLIIGGGLAGLALAQQLQQRGQDYALVEARSRLGGRIKTEACEGAHFDMGPAWFWPGQPRIAALIDTLGLEKFDQYHAGALIFEDAQRSVQRGKGFASMQGSWRLKGGLTALTDALAARIPQDRIHLNAEVTRLDRTGEAITATMRDSTELTADKIALTVPPRIAADLTFTPALPTEAIATMKAIPTWMAGQAKAVAVFDTPFWREAGLSGDASSQHGPMVEVHDASPHAGGPYALFGFIGVPPTARADQDALRHHIAAQFVRLFGPQAAAPKALFIKDWAFDMHTAMHADQTPMRAHPNYGMPRALCELWDGDVAFAGTEVATQFGGYLEGALEAVDAYLAHHP